MFPQPNRDPDAAIVALFSHHPLKNEAKSTLAGRPIFDDIEVVQIRFPGSRALYVFPATSFSHWHNDPLTGEQTPITYVERFPRQYQQFKMQQTQTKSGTPLKDVPFLTEARRAELRALNIYTVEQLAGIDGQELKNLGQNGRDLKNKAQEYISESRLMAPNAAMVAELEALKARNAILEEDAKARGKMEVNTPDADKADASFDEMSLEQLREYITTNSGHAPHGSIGRKTLVRMAADVAQQKV